MSFSLPYPLQEVTAEEKFSVINKLIVRNFSGQIQERKSKLDQEKVQNAHKVRAEQLLLWEKRITVLLLGEEDAGKSTVFKQAHLIYDSGFTEQAIYDSRHVINRNIITGAAWLIRALDKLKLSLIFRKELIAKMYNELQPTSIIRFSPQDVSDLVAFWKDSIVQQAWVEGYQAFHDLNIGYFLNSVERIAHEDYKPTDQDILQSKSKTVKTEDKLFSMDQIQFYMVDVNDTRSIEGRWIRDATTVIFVASLPGYSYSTGEDPSITCIHDSIKLFGGICNTDVLSETTIILFLNKKDIFAERLKNAPLNSCFSDYHGSNEYAESLDFIVQKFLAANHNSNRNIIVYATCAVDTQEMTTIFKGCFDVILYDVLHIDGVL